MNYRDSIVFTYSSLCLFSASQCPASAPPIKAALRRLAVIQNELPRSRATRSQPQSPRRTAAVLRTAFAAELRGIEPTEIKALGLFPCACQLCEELR